jgi:hypothetical protein
MTIQITDTPGNAQRVDARQPANVGSEPPPPRYDFDEPKLLELIERAQQSTVLRRDLAERVRDAREVRNRYRAAIDRSTTGRPSRADQAGLERAEATLNRLIAEQETLKARQGPAVLVAQRCEDWARSRGWLPEGAPGEFRGPALRTEI